VGGDLGVQGRQWQKGQMIALAPSPGTPADRAGHSEGLELPKGLRVTGVFSFGRDALWWLAAIQLAEVNEVWLPEFCCPQVVRVFRKVGWTLRSYRLSGNLRIDWKALRSMEGGSCSAFLFTDLLGFPEPDLSEHAGVLKGRFQHVIRDSAQGLPSEPTTQVSGGSTGCVVFSLRKPLPVPDLAMICEYVSGVEGSRLVPSPRFAQGSIHPTILRLLYAKAELALLRRPAFRASSVGKAIRRILKTGYRYGQRPTRQSWSCAAGMRLSETVAARRRNAGILLDRLDRFSLFADIPLDSSPYYFPLQVENPKVVQQELRRHGIETTRLWGMQGLWNGPGSPEMQQAVRKLLCLPVHQGIGRSEMERLADITKRIVTGGSSETMQVRST